MTWHWLFPDCWFKQDPSSILILATSLCLSPCNRKIDFFFFLLFITQRKACITRSSNICTKSGGNLFTRVFSPALHCCSASSQTVAAHICCGDRSAPLVCDYASLPSSLNNATHAFHFLQSHLIYSSSNLAPERVQKIFFAFSSPPQSVQFLGILAINFGFSICGGWSPQKHEFLSANLPILSVCMSLKFCEQTS